MLNLLISIFFFIACKAQASIYFEPYGGYGFGETHFEYTVTPGTQVVSKVTGWGGGARSGLVLFGTLFLGPDFTYHKVSLKADSTGAKEGNGSQLMLGASGGLLLPGGLRAWGGYYLKNELILDATQAINYKEKFYGKSWKAGIGAPLFSFLHLNVEYVKNDWKKYHANSSEMTILDAGIQSIKHEFYFISLSIPFGLTGDGRSSKKAASIGY